MDRDDAQLLGGVLLLALGAAVLFGSVALWASRAAVLAVGTLLLALGALLVGWSRRGRPV